MIELATHDALHNVAFGDGRFLNWMLMRAAVRRIGAVPLVAGRARSMIDSCDGDRSSVTGHRSPTGVACISMLNRRVCRQL
jgi:hypothetical protein